MLIYMMSAETVADIDGTSMMLTIPREGRPYRGGC